MNRPHRVEATPPECALAAEMFDHFCSASTMKQILALHREICNTLNLKPNRLLDFYPKLKKKLESSWKAQALFKKFDARANHKVYMKGQACPQTRVLIIGAGPCGLRAAIECQLLGAKVVVIEKRDRISRNNVLHLWPFVIQDLRALGAKKFFGKFCAGSIDHISIRQLQCILLKVALLLGVEFHEGVSFEELLEPTVTDNNETLGWRARVSPADHPVSQYEFDTLMGADGRRNTLEGFKRKEFRGKLAMAITANFINRHSEQEASVPEISGVAFIFNQKFFKDLYKETDIDLENIVYYKDETHYFVMTAKKHSLLKKGVLKQDYSEVNRLLNVENVDREALMRYAQEAARFSTDNRLPLNDFALNHYGVPDVALFDFTSMYAAENASMVCERHNRRLLCLLVGDSLLEPFWPTGSGCARGFLSALDAAWAVRAWGQSPTPHPLCVIAERESIYRLLAQTTPENLHRDFGAYTLDPGTRYPNLNRSAVTPHRVTAFYDSDEPLRLDAVITSRKRHRDAEIPDQVLMSWLGIDPGLGVYEAASPQCLAAVVRRYRPDLLSVDVPDRSVYHVLQEELDIAPFVGAPREVPEAKLRSYLVRVYFAFKGEVPHVHHDSDVFGQIKRSQQTEKYGRNNTDHSLSMYSNAADTEKSHSTKRKRRTPRPPIEEGRIVSGGGRNLAGGVRVARLAAELASGNSGTTTPKSSKPKDLMRSVGKIERNDWNVMFIEKKIQENKLGRPEPKTAERVPKWDRAQFLGRQRRLQEGESEEKWGEFDETIHKIDQKLKDSGRPDHGTKKVANLATKFVKKDDGKEDKAIEDAKDLKKTWRGPSTTGTQCAACNKRVFAAESVTADGLHLHKGCFKCAVCKTILRPGNYTMERYGSRLVCLRHSGTNVPDSVEAVKAAAEALNRTEALKRTRTVQPTPERIILEASDTGAREIDEDEWTDRNFLASETSGAGGLSDDDESSTEEYTSVEESGGEDNDAAQDVDHPQLSPRHLYFSTDSFGYDDSDDGAESSGESCSRMREAREARRREVPADAHPPTDSSEVASEDESSSSSDSNVSSATEVSTDSEFAREEHIPPPTPPAILVTAPPPAPPQALEYPLSRTKSAGGIATKRALELKRKYLLGEPSPPAVRKSDSTSQLDTKFEAFRSNITGFQKLLQMSPQPPSRQIITIQLLTEKTEKNPIPDIIKNIYDDAPVDLLPNDKVNGTDWKEEKNASNIDTDSLSDDVTHTENFNQSVPRVEVHNEGGELIQLDSLTIISNSEEKEDNNPTITSSVPTVLAVESESSESCKDATTLALTETELSDWAAESVLDDCRLDDKEDKQRNKNPRTLSGPKTIHDAKNVCNLAAHVCGKSSPPETVVYSNALEHFEFVDEGEQEYAIGSPVTPKNEGYMEFVDDEYDPYSIANDRSMNFIERSCSEIAIKPDNDEAATPVYPIERSFSEVVAQRDDDDRAPSPTYSIELLMHDTINTIIESEMNELKTTESAFEDQTPNSESESSAVSKGNLEELKTPKMLSMMENNGNNSLDNSNIEDKKNADTNSYEKSPEYKNDSDPKPLSENSMLLETPSSTNSSKFDKFDEDINGLSKNPSSGDISPPLYDSLITKSASNHVSLLPQTPLYSPSICRSASENFGRKSSSSISKPTDLSLDLSSSLSQDSKTPVGDLLDKLQVISREIEEQKEVVRRLVLERLGGGGLTRRSTRRVRASPVGNIPPPIPPPILKLPTPPVTPEEERKTEAPPPRPIPPSPAAMKAPKDEKPPPRPVPPTNLGLNLVKTPPSLSDTELARDRRHNGIIKSLSNYLTKRRSPRNKWVSEPDIRQNESPPQPPSSLRPRSSHKSTGALETPPPVPPPPARYRPPPHHAQRRNIPSSSRSEAENGASPPVQWYEARWTRLLAQRRRDDTHKTAHDAQGHENGRKDGPTASRIARLEKALSRPLSAEQQAATVAELVQVSAQRVAHEALLAADRNRNASPGEKKYVA